MHLRLGNLIRARRRVRGLTVEDLAARIDCETSTVRRWERDGVVPAARYMLALREVLDIPLTLMDEACLAAMSPARPILRIESEDYLRRTGKNYATLLADIIDFDIRTFGITDVSDEGTIEQWAPIHQLMPETWRLLTLGDRIVGNWHIVPLDDASFARAKCGAMRDGDITIDAVALISFPGFYNAYLSSFALDGPYRHGRPFQMLIESLLDCLSRFAADGIFFREFVTPGFTVEGRKLLERLGFERIGLYAGMKDKPLYAASTRTLTNRPEFIGHEYLRQLYNGDL